MILKFDPLKKLYIIILSGTVLLIALHVYIGRGFFFEERKKEKQAEMEIIAVSLVQEFPAKSFTDLAIQNKNGDTTLEEQVMSINGVLQPIVERTAISHRRNIQIGYYSAEHNAVVAINQGFDPERLMPVDNGLFMKAYESGEPATIDMNKAPFGSGDSRLYTAAPVYYQGRIIGHSFVIVNLTDAVRELNTRNAYSFLVLLLLISCIIMLVRRCIRKIKDELRAFGDSIAKGGAYPEKTIFSELNGILDLLRHQAKNIARLDSFSLIGEIAASIGHEIRNPLTTVRGYLQYFGTKPEMEKFQGQLSLMLAELDRANAIIAEFLSLAKNKTVDLKPLKLNEIISGLAPLIQANALHLGCQVSFRNEEVPLVMLDENEIRQLIFNLVRNAFEAMPQGGTVIISTTCEGNCVTLSITDEGKGIPPTLLDRLGTPFLSTKESGTGLGLAVCYRIAQRHKAVIKIESQVGVGSVFKVIFNCDSVQ